MYTHTIIECTGVRVSMCISDESVCLVTALGDDGGGQTARSPIIRIQQLQAAQEMCSR